MLKPHFFWHLLRAVQVQDNTRDIYVSGILPKTVKEFSERYRIEKPSLYQYHTYLILWGCLEEVVLDTASTYFVFCVFFNLTALTKILIQCLTEMVRMGLFVLFLGEKHSVFHRYV